MFRMSFTTSIGTALKTDFVYYSYSDKLIVEPVRLNLHVTDAGSCFGLDGWKIL